MKNHYQILGIKRNAPQAEIRQAYQKLAMKLRPDNRVDDPFFEEYFKQIREAYEVLTDSYRKGLYDSEFDRFLDSRPPGKALLSETTHHQSINTWTNIDYEGELIQKAEEDRLAKKKYEQQRSKEIKRETELLFEDKAWIAIASGLSLGIIGVIMFLKYQFEGYNKKRNRFVSWPSLDLLSSYPCLFL